MFYLLSINTQQSGWAFSPSLSKERAETRRDEAAGPREMNSRPGSVQSPQAQTLRAEFACRGLALRVCTCFSLFIPHLWSLEILLPHTNGSPAFPWYISLLASPGTFNSTQPTVNTSSSPPDPRSPLYQASSGRLCNSPSLVLTLQWLAVFSPFQVLLCHVDTASIVESFPHTSPPACTPALLGCPGPCA